MIVVADSSPLVILAKLGYFDLLNQLYPLIYISAEVHYEIVVAGAGLPGAADVAEAAWIEVKQIQNPQNLSGTQQRYGLGVGELSAIFIAREMGADVVLLDDHKARKLAAAEGLRIRGSLGLLEAFYLHGHLTDLRGAFRELIRHSYIDRRLLDRRLSSLKLPPL